MLVPLETFSGWPQVPNPTPLQSLTLLIGIPLLIALIVIATAKPSVPDETAEGDGTGGRVASGEATVADQQIEGDDTGEHVGGAGARW